MKDDLKKALREKENFNNSFFKESVFRILSNNGEVLILIRYPYAAGKKDFVLIKDTESLIKLFEGLEPRDSITVIRAYSKIKDGILDNQSITLLRDEVKKQNLNSLEWLVLGTEGEIGWHSWLTLNDMEEFKEIIEEEIGKHIVVIEEFDWFDSENTIHAYVPDEDGIVRLGVY